MKEVIVILFELTKEEAAALPDGTQVLIYNPIMDSYRLERMSRSSLARSRHAAQYIKYFVFSKPNTNIN